jgi:hypothetical protein
MEICKFVRAPFVAALFAAAIVGMAHTAAAQPPATTPTTPTGQWSVTPYAAVGFSGDLDQATKNFGVAADYGWTPRVSFEGDLNILPTSEASGVYEFGTHAWTVTGNLLYHFAQQPFVPYGVVGIGYGHGGADSNEVAALGLTAVASTSSNTFVVDFGGGVERALTNRVRLRGDLRYFFGGDLVPSYWRLGAGVSFDLRH